MAKTSMAEALEREDVLDKERWLQEKQEAVERGQDFIKNGLPNGDPAPIQRKSTIAAAVGKSFAAKIPYSVRLEADTVRGIKHIAFENKMNGLLPNTEQSVVQEALNEYLRKVGW